jgi:hypothetical protein
MAVRYVLRMTRQSDQRRFGWGIPIVLHCIFAAFLFVYGSFLAAS